MELLWDRGTAVDQAEFLAGLGLDGSALDRFIRAAYGLLDLISGTKARQAAGKIHSDLERGFIRAEVIPYETFIEP